MNFWKRLLCRHAGKLDFVGNVHGDCINNHRGARSVWQCPKCGKYLYKKYLGEEIIYVPNGNVGEMSDGYHTFNELYDHRAKLFAIICHDHQDLAWKSLHHEDGSMYDGMFVVGIDTPLGQATYHYDIDPYWDMFKVKEFERAPKWVGCNTSYMKARRDIRKRDRSMRDLPKKLSRGLVRGAKRVNRSTAEAVSGFAKLASSLARTSMFPLRATVLVIDEMAFYDDTRPQWPKENPHIKKEVLE